MVFPIDPPDRTPDTLNTLSSMRTLFLLPILLLTTIATHAQEPDHVTISGRQMTKGASLAMIGYYRTLADFMVGNKTYVSAPIDSTGSFSLTLETHAESPAFLSLDNGRPAIEFAMLPGDTVIIDFAMAIRRAPSISVMSLVREFERDFDMAENHTGAEWEMNDAAVPADPDHITEVLASFERRRHAWRTFTDRWCSERTASPTLAEYLFRREEDRKIAEALDAFSITSRPQLLTFKSMALPYFRGLLARPLGPSDDAGRWLKPTLGYLFYHLRSVMERNEWERYRPRTRDLRVIDTTCAPETRDALSAALVAYAFDSAPHHFFKEMIRNSLGLMESERPRSSDTIGSFPPDGNPEELLATFGAYGHGSVYYDAAKAYVDRHARLLPGHEAPDFALTDTAGRTVHLRDLRGHPLVLTFWTTFHREGSDYLRTIEKIRDSLSAEVTIVCIHLGPEEKEWHETIRGHSSGIIHVHDSHRWWEGTGALYGLRRSEVGYPFYLPFAIDDHGHIFATALMPDDPNRMSLINGMCRR